MKPARGRSADRRVAGDPAAEPLDGREVARYCGNTGAYRHASGTAPSMG
jgi:hypothetical protein